MKKILVPMDFSPASVAAFRFAEEVASAVSGEVFIAHAIEAPVIHESTFGVHPYLYAQEVARESMANAMHLFEKLKASSPPDVPLTFVPVYEELIHGLAELVDQRNIDLVVMSTHGASGLEEFIVGSKAEKIARHSRVPVLTIPRTVSMSSIKSIVFPNTLSLDQSRLVGAVKEVQQLFGARLHILLVNTPEAFHTDEEAGQMLRHFATFFELQNVELHFRSSDHERTGIVSFATEIHADMIAMGTHGRKGFAHFIKGSIAESVLNHVDCPVWISKMDRT